MSKNNYICTWIYCDSKEEESTYPQVGSNSSEQEFQNVYWRCLTVYFASSWKNNPDAKHILFTNTENIPEVDGTNIKALLKQFGVQIIVLPLQFQTPEGYFFGWRNQFYIFDILNYIAKHFEDNDTFIILDSDCVWVDSAARIVEDIRKYGLLTYALPYDLNFNIHGLTRTDLKSIYEELDHSQLEGAPIYFGGEWFAATGKEIKKISLISCEVWNQSLEQFYQDKPKFNEEAHMLSYIYHKLGYLSGTADQYIRRIWTIPSISRDASEKDLELAVWHCPSEKKYGIQQLFQDACVMDSSFWSSSPNSEFSRYVGQYFGIPKYSDRLIPVEGDVFKQVNKIKEALNGRKIKIFGAGSFGKNVKDILEEHGLEIDGFFDNDEKKWGQEFHGKLVSGTKNIDNSEFIVVASIWAPEIRGQLERLGLKEGENFIIYSLYN